MRSKVHQENGKIQPHMAIHTLPPGAGAGANSNFFLADAEWEFPLLWPSRPHSSIYGKLHFHNLDKEPRQLLTVGMLFCPQPGQHLCVSVWLIMSPFCLDQLKNSTWQSPRHCWQSTRALRTEAAAIGKYSMWLEMLVYWKSCCSWSIPWIFCRKWHSYIFS